MFNIFKKTKITRAIFFIATDVVSIAVAFSLAFLIRFDWNIPDHYLPIIIRIIALAVIFILPIFYFQKLYSFSWVYASINEVVSLLKATTLSFLLLGVTLYISKYFPYFDFPRSIIVMSYFLVLALCSLTRFAKKMYFHAHGINQDGQGERTLIVGAGSTGEQIVRNIKSSKTNNYLPVGFVDNSLKMQGLNIHGLKVLGTIASIPAIVKEKKVKQLIVAIPYADTLTIKKAVELGRSAGLYKIKIVPPLAEFIRGDASLKNLKSVDTEDLLGRESVTLDKKQIEQFIHGKTVLITGAAGSIGSELSRQVAKFKPSSLVLLDQDETGIFSILHELKEKFPHLAIRPLVKDVTDNKSLERIFKEHQPKVVFHAAAYKHVPLMEEHSDEAVKNNVFGTEALIDASLTNSVEKFIFVSTDKAINPTSIMGATKRIGEMICQAASQHQKTSFISVRFGNVLNSRGSVIPIFKDQIKRGGPVQVTHPDMKRYFMLISEACLLVMQAGAMGRGGEVFVLDMGKPVKIVDLAREMIKLSGFKPDEDIAIVFTGIRPGEKLFEEIMTNEENTMATQHQKIFTAKLATINSSELQTKLVALKEASFLGDKEEVKHIIKAIIPSFASQKPWQS